MRKVTKLGVRNPEAAVAKKRGRPPKKRESMVEQMEKSADPDIQHCRDLTHYDRSEILGRDPNFEYRWSRADRIGQREQQGYIKDDSDSVKTSHEGKEWPPEGKDTRRANGGLVLMKIPKALYEKRAKIKEEKTAAASNAEETRFRSGVVSDGGAVLADSDPFVQELANS